MAFLTNSWIIGKNVTIKMAGDEELAQKRSVCLNIFLKTSDYYIGKVTLERPEKAPTICTLSVQQLNSDSENQLLTETIQEILTWLFYENEITKAYVNIDSQDVDLISQLSSIGFLQERIADNYIELFIEKGKFTGNTIQIKAGKADPDAFYHYVKQWDSDFFEPLSARINLADYAKKIGDKATTFTASYCGELAGLIAAYFYETESKKGFITLVHTISNYRGKHIGERLVEETIKYGKSIGFKYIDLVVYKHNMPAYNLYIKNKFTVLKDDEGRCLMRYTIA